MGSVQKIGDDYFIEFYARGLKYQQKVGPDKAKAEEALKTIEEKIARGEAALIVRDVDIDIFFEDFLQYVPSEHTPKTVARIKLFKEYFTKFLQSQYPHLTKLSQISPSVVGAYKIFLEQSFDKRGRLLKAGVVNLSLLLLRCVFMYAMKLGYLNDDPGLHVYFVLDERDFRYIDSLKGRNSRINFALELLSKGVPLTRLYKILNYDDLAKVVRFVPFIPKTDWGVVHKVQ